MRKEIYEKMNQLDRIEYNQERADTFSWALILSGTGIICGAVAIADNELWLAAKFITVAIVAFIVLTLAEKILNSILDKEYLKRLDMKPKK